MLKTFCRTCALAAIVASAGCTVHDTVIPDMTGPSQYAQGLNVTAAPDTLTEDGSSTATITIRASGPDGQPLVGLEIRLALGGAHGGILSPTTVFTGRDGRATATYTAPLASPFAAGGPSATVIIYATPVGSNYQAATSQSAWIRVTPPPAPVQAAGAPSAVLLMSTATPKVGQLVTFDASASSAQAGHNITTYFWDFGDGLPNDEHGNDASHAYQAAGTYYVVLGVVDDLGRIDSDIHTITVSN